MILYVLYVLYNHEFYNKYAQNYFLVKYITYAPSSYRIMFYLHMHMRQALVVKGFILQQFALKIDKHSSHVKAIVISIVLS